MRGKKIGFILILMVLISAFSVGAVMQVTNETVTHINTGISSAYKLTQTGDTGNIAAALQLICTDNDGLCTWVYSNNGADQDEPLFLLEANNALYDEAVVEIKNQGVGEHIILTGSGTGGIDAGGFDVYNADNINASDFYGDFTGDLAGTASSATNWASVSSFVTEWFNDVADVLTFNETHLNDTIAALSSGTNGTITSISTTAPIAGGDITTTGTISLVACGNAEGYVYNITSGAFECRALGSGAGSVTSVATDNTYLTGGPITGSGTITFNTTLAGESLTVNNSIYFNGNTSDKFILVADEATLNVASALSLNGNTSDKFILVADESTLSVADSVLFNGNTSDLFILSADESTLSVADSVLFNGNTSNAFILSADESTLSVADSVLFNGNTSDNFILVADESTLSVADSVLFNGNTSDAFILSADEATLSVASALSLNGNTSDAFILSADEATLDVASATSWASVSSFIAEWFYDNTNVLTFNETHLNATINAISGAGTVTAVTATSPILSSEGTTPVISATIAKDLVTTAPLTGAVDNVFLGTDSDITIAIPVATSSADGYLDKDDWTTFNNKADIDTTYTAGTGLNLTANEFELNRTFTDLRYYTQTAADSQFIEDSSEGDLNVNNSVYFNGNTSDAFALLTDLSDLNVNSSVYLNGNTSDDFILKAGDTFTGNVIHESLEFSDSALTVYRNKTTVFSDAALVNITQDNPNDDQPDLTLKQEGTSSHIDLIGTGTGGINLGGFDIYAGDNINASNFYGALTGTASIATTWDGETSQADLSVADSVLFNGNTSDLFILSADEGTLSVADSVLFNGNTSDAFILSADEGTLSVADSVLFNGNTSDAFLLSTGDTATGNYTFDSTTFKIDASNNKIGIGTTSPSSTLDVIANGANIAVRSANTWSSSFKAFTWATGAVGSSLQFYKSRSGTYDVANTTVTGDNIGAIYYKGTDALNNSDYGAYWDTNQIGNAGVYVPIQTDFKYTSDANYLNIVMSLNYSGAYFPKLANIENLYATNLESDIDGTGFTITADLTGTASIATTWDGETSQGDLSVADSVLFNGNTSDAFILSADEGTLSVADSVLFNGNTSDAFILVADEGTLSVADSVLFNGNTSDAFILSGGTLTNGKWCVYDGTGIDCNVEPVSDTTYSAGTGIALGGTEFTVAGGTALTADAGGLSVTAGGIGDTQIADAYINQALTTTSAVDFSLAKITQTATSGNGLWVYRNLASASTDSPLIFIEQDEAGDDQTTLFIQQDGTGDGIFVDQNGNGLGMIIHSDATTATNYGLKVLTGTGATAGYFESDNTYIKLASADASSSGAFLVFRDAVSATTTASVVKIIQDNTGDDQNTLNIQNDGTGVAIALSGAGNQSITGVECITFASGGKICSGT